MSEKEYHYSYVPAVLTKAVEDLAAMYWDNFKATDEKLAPALQAGGRRLENLVDRCFRSYLAGFMEQVDRQRMLFHLTEQKEEGEPRLQIRTEVKEAHDSLITHSRATYMALALRTDPEIAYMLVGKLIRASMEAIRFINPERLNQMYVAVPEKDVVGVIKAIEAVHKEYKAILRDNDQKFYARIRRSLGGVNEPSR